MKGSSYAQGSSLEHLRASLRIAAARRTERRGRLVRRVKLVTVAAATVLALAGAAVAADRMFGEPAPDAVKRDIAAVDNGLPPSIHLDPHASEAIAVAKTDSAVLYSATLDDGGYCMELVIDGKQNAATCVTAAQLPSLPLPVSISTADPGTTTGPVTVGGRVNVGTPDHLEVTIGHDTRVVDIGDDGFFAFDLSTGEISAARAGGLVVRAVDAQGDEIANNDLGAVFAESPPPTQPLEFTYRSAQSDLSLLRGIDGRVNDATITTVTLVYPDGHRQDVPLDGGEFHVRIPDGRQGDFADSAGSLVGATSDGRVVVRMPVASVSFYAGAERSGRLGPSPSPTP